jgi:hypothetical protein
MAAQYDRRNEILFGERQRHSVRFAAFCVPRLPRRDVLL